MSVLGLGVEVALDAVIDESDKASCNDNTASVRLDELNLAE
jgi:hypothetical protein